MSSKDQIETNLDRSTKQGLNSKDKAYIADSAEHASQDDEILEHALPPADSEERNTLERALVRKLDLRLLPMIFLIYIMNYIDVRPAVYSSSCCVLLLNRLATLLSGTLSLQRG